MPRYREKPVDPFIQKLLKLHKCKTLKEASEKTGIPIGTLCTIADRGPSRKQVEELERFAAAYRVTLDEYAAMVKRYTEHRSKAAS